MEQLDEILRDHTTLKEEFETLLGYSRLPKRKRRREESVEVTPSYQIRPEAEVGSSSNEVLNEKMSNLEDKLMKEDMLMHDLAAVIRFGKDALKDPKLSEKPPPGFNRVLDWFCGGKEVPQRYKTHPKLAATYILPIMQTTLEEMTRTKTIRAISVYKRASQNCNVRY
ncbi:hypothetical protein Rs2_21131 [Raphanus sativus]|nr:hypothetical protein Rs2_21131 [Raphanus sativus]